MTRAADREAGSTLIEVLVAVVIMGLAFVVIVGGIGTAIIGSDLQQQQASMDAALRSAAEQMSYMACPPSGEPDYGGQLSGFVAQGVALSVTEVSYWEKNPDPALDAFVAGPPCLEGLHLLRLTASSTSGRATSPETLDVVKRRP